MNEGFKRITYKFQSPKIEVKAKKRPSFNLPKKVIILPILIIGLLGVLILLLAFPARDLYFSFQKVSQIGKEAYNAMKNKDIDTTLVRIRQVKSEFENSKKIVSKISFTKTIPFIGSYTKDVEHIINAGISGAKASEIAIDAILPYSDLLGFKGESSFVQGSAEERIKTAVETFDKLVPKIDEISQEVEKIKQELDQIEAQKYPEEIAGVKIRSKLTNVKNLFSQSSKFFIEARPLLKKLPFLFGVEKERKYLVLFQNDAELRATGGFITAYAIFNIDAGKIKVEKADDIYKLDEAKRKKFPAPEAIIKYHKDVPNFELRDSNLSPDFVESMKKFESMLEDSVSDFPSYDGIIALDTHVLVSAIKILGEFNIYGRSFSSEIDKRCDCPKAIYELEDYATRPVAYVRETRKDIIGVLMLQIMKRALGVSPSQYWGQLFQMFIDEANQKHILFYIKDKEAQNGIEALNWAGRIVSSDRDYLHINDVNFAGAKSNLFIEQSVLQEISIGNDGGIEKKLTISYKNPAPASNCNLEAGQLCLNGILRNWIRIYTPKGSELLEFTGSEKETSAYQDLDKTVFEGFLTVKPQGASQAVIRYKLPIKAKKGDAYSLLIQKQPGKDSIEHIIKINNKEISKILLIEDKQLLLTW